MATSSMLGLIFEIGADAKKAEAAMARLNAASVEQSGSVSSVWSSAMQAITGPTAIVTGGLLTLGGGMLALTEKAAHMGEEFAHTAEKTGLTVAEVSALRFATEQTGTSLDAVTRAIGVLSKGTSDLSTHMTPAKKALEELGISLTHPGGAPKSTHELLLEVAEAFKRMPDGAAKSAEAMALFGRAGLAMIPFLNQGAAGIAALEAQAKKLGVTMTDEDAKAAAKTAQEMRALSAEIDGIELAIGKRLVPGLGILVGLLTQDADATSRFTKAVKETFAPAQLWSSLIGETMANATSKAVSVLIDVTNKLGLFSAATLLAERSIHGSGLVGAIEGFLIPAYDRLTAAAERSVAAEERATAENLKGILSRIAGRRAQAAVETGVETAKGFAALAAYDFWAAAQDFTSAAEWAMVAGSGGRRGGGGGGGRGAESRYGAGGGPGGGGGGGEAGGGGYRGGGPAVHLTYYQQGPMVVGANAMQEFLDQISNGIQAGTLYFDTSRFPSSGAKPT